MTKNIEVIKTRKKKDLSNVLLLFAGGTISMHKNEATGTLDVAHGADQFFELEPRVVEIANLDVAFIDNVDSTNADHVLWEKFVSVINAKYEDYDGFVITMGTNTLAYAASALSFAFQQIGKPVIITGAQIPAEIISTDGRNNLVNSLRVATMDLAGVFVVFGSKIILGCRSKKYSESDLDAFKTFNKGDFGEIAIGIKINDRENHRSDKPLISQNGFEDNISSITVVPGIRAEHMINLIDGGVRGIVLRGFGSGDVPYSILPALDYAREKEVPVIVTTQCPGGATVMGLNDPGLKALEAGVIQAFDMSMESMTTKMMWMLKQGIPYKNFKKYFHANMCGEVDTQEAKFFLNKELESLYAETDEE